MKNMKSRSMKIIAASLTLLLQQTPTTYGFQSLIRPAAAAVYGVNANSIIGTSTVPTPPFLASRTVSHSSSKLYNFLNEGKKAVVKMFAGDYDSVAIRDKVTSLIDNNPVLMLSFTTCPYCIKAKSVLDSTNAKYTVIELDIESDGKAIRAEMANIIGRTSVPAIWINKQFIGGCNDGPMGGIVKLNDSGKLQSMLKEASAL
jgi:glutaredoxin 3